jgi:hypothetical protein
VIKNLLVWTVVFSLMIALSSVHGYAQGMTRADDQPAELTGTRKQVATIIFSGLAGAILGLSTLSFYGRPQEKLDNIAMGAALGVIVGTVYTTYKVTRAPYDMYRGVELDTQTEYEKRFSNVALNRPVARAQWSWTF